jgi:hypothetical protein
MQPNQPVPERQDGNKRLDEKPPGKKGDGPKLPFEGGADEHASKSDFPGQADQRTADDKDGNAEQAKHGRARSATGGSGG